ncbi:MAG: efflux RND transporter periplasmic adaptor subunit, partial [Spirochaetales bacterium]|nr:efflux RND transporter periplasmic adaptor subunit [Spirochaetales bacterium]
LAEMSGRLESVAADYNDRVATGQVLATINTDFLKLKAKIAQASVDKASANYELKVLDATNARTLFDKGLLSEYDLKTSIATMDAAAADLSSATASLEEIQTEINQYAIITSPIDGIVLERGVEAGQSVVGSSSGSSTRLFTIAEDLSMMQIEADVDELDISSVFEGQTVRCTVEADPGKTFAGKVKERRLVPSSTDNVVYYTVIILVDNATGTLLPGMTANVEFIKEQKKDVLVVPAAAFRFTPSTLGDEEIQKAVFLARLGDVSDEEKATAIARFEEQLKARAVAGQSGEAASGLSSLMGGGMPGAGGPGGPGGMGEGRPGASRTGTGTAPVSAAAAAAMKTLWYINDAGELAVTLVEAGVSDGSKTELLNAEDLEGQSFIVKVKVN